MDLYACLIVSLVAVAAFAVPAQAQQPSTPLIPLPAAVQRHAGSLQITPSTPLFVAAGTEEEARLLADSIYKVTGVKLDKRPGKRPGAYTGGIEISLEPGLVGLGPEGYTLEVTDDGVALKAGAKAGLFYGVQTLRQLLPAAKKSDDEQPAIPCVSIVDQPRFGVRGFMLDSSRHMVKTRTVLALLDALASIKINRFHWHLVDDNAWRLAISKYPDLVKPIDIKADWYTQADGFYSAKDVRAVVARAKRLHITIVPEIEMPSHARQAASVLPEASCLDATGKPLPPGSTREICLGSDRAIRALEDVLVETMALFPDSPVIHLGGDEADDDHWRACPRCQARMKQLGMTDPRLLQKWFMDKMNRFVQEHGRRSIAWADRLGLGIPEGQIVHAWHGGESEEAVAKGFDVVQSQHDYTYFDYGQGPGDTMFGGAGLPIERVYAFDPVRGLPADQAARVLGPQAQLWTELVVDSRVFSKTFPRILALAEVGWTPAQNREYADFAARLNAFLPRLDAMHIPYFKMPSTAGSWNPQDMSTEWKELEWDVPSRLKPGDIRLEFQYTRGAHALVIESAALFEDGREVSRDTHPGRTGAGNQANVYGLKLKSVKPGAKYTVRARVRSDGGTDSSGLVMLR